MRKLLCILLTLFVCLAGFRPDASAAPVKLTILQTTDIHGAIGDAKTPGLLQIADFAEQLKPDLWIDCGDLTQGAYTATMDGGASMLKALSAAGCDVFVPGNHDFDAGVEPFAEQLKEYHGTVLAANMKSTVAPMKTADWKVFQRQGVKIAASGDSN